MIGYADKGVTTKPDSPTCLAKQSEGENEAFFIRFNRQSGLLFDPYDVYSSSNLIKGAKIKGTDIEAYPFIQVSKETFDLYMNYLKGKPRCNLIQANRTSKL